MRLKSQDGCCHQHRQECGNDKRKREGDFESPSELATNDAGRICAEAEECALRKR